MQWSHKNVTIDAYVLSELIYLFVENSTLFQVGLLLCVKANEVNRYCKKSLYFLAQNEIGVRLKVGSKVEYCT